MPASVEAGRVVFQKDFNADVFLPRHDGEPVGRGFEHRMALRISWPASCARMAWMMPSSSAFGVISSRSCAMTSGWLALVCRKGSHKPTIARAQTVNACNIAAFCQHLANQFFDLRVFIEAFRYRQYFRSGKSACIAALNPSGNVRGGRALSANQQRRQSSPPFHWQKDQKPCRGAARSPLSTPT